MSSLSSAGVDLSRSRLIVAPAELGIEGGELTATTRVKSVVSASGGGDSGSESEARRSSSSSVLLSATVRLAPSESRSGSPPDAPPRSLWVWVTAPLLGKGGSVGGAEGAGATTGASAGVAVAAAGRAELRRRRCEQAARGGVQEGSRSSLAAAPVSSSEISDSGSEDDEEEEPDLEADGDSRGGGSSSKSKSSPRDRNTLASARLLAEAASALAGEVDAATLAMERALLLLARGSKAGSGNGKRKNDDENVDGSVEKFAATTAAVKAWYAARDAAALTDAAVEEALR